MKVSKLILILLIILLTVPLTYAEAALELTEDELQFIEDHPVIYLGIDPSFVPYEFIDDDGKYKGLANEYVKLINKKTGLNMSVVYGKTWSEVYIDAVEKRIDVLPCVSKTSEREKYFLYSEPYYEFQRVIILNEDSEVKSETDLKNHTVAIQRNSSHQNFVDRFPEITISYYDTVEEALLAVANGTEEAFIGNLATSSHIIKTKGFTNLKYVSIDSDKNYLHFAIRSDWPELQSIINKALELVTDEEKKEIQDKWIGLSKEYDFTNIIRITIGVTSMIIIGVIVSFYWIRKLKKEIKKRIEIEAALEVAKKEAELSNEVKSNFLARMSHEIRTPLNAITGLSYILNKSDLNRTQKSHIDKISHASSIMLSLINDILDFSKIEAGKVDIDHSAFDLDLVIKNVIHIIAFKVEEKELDFTLIKEPSLPNHFYGDSKRIEQILLNIINNAVKFTSNGGITFHVNLIGHQRDEYQIEFRIKDTGIGMSKEHMTHLFEPFTQEDASISRRFGGTGLGLSIVKSLTEMMDGSIEVLSEVNEGSEFILTLSLEVNQEKELEVKNNFKYIKDIKTLVLNKKINTLNLTTEYLKSFGILPEFTSSINEFIKLLTSTKEKVIDPYNLVVIDMALVTEEDFKLFDDFYCHSNHIKPKVILITSFNNEENSYNKDYIILSKPIFSSILYNAIVDLFHFKVMASHLEHDGKDDLLQNIKGRVLIVEDNKTNQLIAQSLLEGMGITVVIANDGQEGVECFNNQPFDLILMDLHMPVMDGYEASRIIRSINKDIPIVAMTADAVDGVIIRCEALGMTHFISKPFDPESFMFEVKTFLKDINVEDDVSTILNKKLGLKQTGGNEKLYQQILMVFYEENEFTTQSLNTAINNLDYAQAIQITHKIKSSAGSIGSNELMHLARDLQYSLKDENQKEIEGLAEKFSSGLNDLLKKIKEKI